MAARGRGLKELQRQKIKMAMAVRSKNAQWKYDGIEPRHWSAGMRLAGLGNAAPLLEGFRCSGGL